MISRPSPRRTCCGAAFMPSVYLFAVDDRIFKYKHAAARGKRLKQYGMLNLCARKWGLAISITRFVHFGEVAGRPGCALQVCGPGECGAARRDAGRCYFGGTFQSCAVCIRGGRISWGRATPPPGRAHRVRRARMGSNSRRSADRRQSTRLSRGTPASAAPRLKTP